jgi:serine phosphatase RsbU (regulator of sigma subunit)
MVITRIFVLNLFLHLFSAINSFAVRSDTLLLELNNAKTDTARVKLCFLLSQEFESKNLDSTLYWLNQGLSISKKCINTPADSIICYYHGIILSSIGRQYAISGKNPQQAAALIDSGLVIFTRLQNEKPGKWLEAKVNKALTVSYGMLGRIAYNQGDLVRATELYTNCLRSLETIGDKGGVAMMYNNLGVMHRLQSNYAQSLFFYQKAYDVFKEAKDSVNVASVLVNIGSVSQDIGAFDKSLENYFKALAIFEGGKKQSNLASTLINIGNVLVKSKNSRESIPYYKRAINIFNSIGDRRGTADSYLSLGACFKELNVLDSANIYLIEAQKNNELLDNKVGLANTYTILGEVFFLQKNFRTALNAFNSALDLSKQIGVSTASISNSIARVYFVQGNVDLSLKWATEALEEARRSELIAIQKDAYETLASIYEKKGQHKLALENFRHFFNLYDSILSLDRAHKFAEMETLYQLEQKERTISQLEKEKALKEVELKQAEIKIGKQRLHSFISLAVLFFLSIVLFLLYRQYRIKRSSNQTLKQQYAEIHQKNEEITAQKEEIESQRNELELQKGLLKEKSEQLEHFNWILIDSIDYASNIQSALLPSNSVFSTYFNDHFIILYPKDVVSGDFYWAYPKNENIIIAVADCTGHGVPGGFMSMLGISALNELMGREITYPSDILNNLRLLIIESLKQTGKIGEQQDGMDISIIRYTKGNDYIEFAGANHPLWVVRENNELGKFEIIEYKGERMPVSYHVKMKPFETKRVHIVPNDQIYLFTDGYRHQLGGHDSIQKFGKEGFKKQILDIAHRDMDNQKNFLEDTFYRWIGNNEQLDDITIMGLKI